MGGDRNAGYALDVETLAGHRYGVVSLASFVVPQPLSLIMRAVSLSANLAVSHSSPPRSDDVWIVEVRDVALGRDVGGACLARRPHPPAAHGDPRCA